MNSSESADNIDYGLNYDEAYFHGLPNYLGEDGFLSDKNFSQTERNGTELTLDAPPRIVNDRTLIPLRAVAEAFGAQVGWDEATLRRWNCIDNVRKKGYTGHRWTVCPFKF